MLFQFSAFVVREYEWISVVECGGWSSYFFFRSIATYSILCDNNEHEKWHCRCGLWLSLVEIIRLWTMWKFIKRDFRTWWNWLISRNMTNNFQQNYIHTFDFQLFDSCFLAVICIRGRKEKKNSHCPFWITQPTFATPNASDAWLLPTKRVEKCYRGRKMNSI